ncbi:AT-rich interactive domain-containing protein 4 [Zea mays]|uniref:AT-rich interactive domain-containing protein 4 n=1 Tax=Zea mays TaxID=4577 RepID=A0A1D6EQU0_MAIZE|nr:AT-rich interactive domain-containing protein 4 [Zea mays]ONM22127.1 AT-rich interactive domain-containing protein 4 [Zea mays]
MSQIQSFSRNNCVLLVVLCGKYAEKRAPAAKSGLEAKRPRPSYPFPELSSAGRLEVHTLFNPTPEQFLEAQRVVQPNFLYIQGQQLEDEKEIGSLVWGDADVSDPQAFSTLISPPFPTIVYLEVPIGEKLAQAVHSKGIPYVIYWRNSFSSYAASHFRHALMSVVQRFVGANCRIESVSYAPTTHRKSTSGPSHTPSVIQLNPLPMKKHGCDRLSIQVCSEEDFLKDVMQFLIQRGHNRLVPHGGLAEFPDAVLNAKRLDLYNLYKEVVSRGGFYVGNGINWKGQVFSKMRNHTATNRMTGVGNTLKRHYETYLLEYELAHDDVDGECCLLCHSSAPGDWVNCGLCGEWAHFGCDRRQGLGTFKDYAKTDGLEYICPHCSLANYKKPPLPPKVANGFSNTAYVPRSV